MSSVGREHGTLAGVQALRAIAAILVVIQHANGMMHYPRFFGSSPYSFVELGQFGVAAFFVISGFIVCVVSLDRDWRPKQSIDTFARKRFFRILPFMWVCVVGYNALTFVATGTVEWLPALRAIIIMVPGELKPNVLWSIRHEIAFYVLFAVCVWYGRSRLIFLAPWFLLPLVVPLMIPVDDPTLNGTDTFFKMLLWIYGQGSNTGANLQFGAGVVLALIWLRGSGAIKPWLSSPLLILLVASIAAVSIVEWLALPNGIAKSVVWTALAMLVVYIAIIGRYDSDSIVTRMCLGLGNASFSLYLTHISVLLIALELVSRLKLRFNETLFLVVVTFAAVAVSIIVHRVVEKPLIRILTPLRVFPSNRVSKS